jgi:hypothetical protein
MMTSLITSISEIQEYIRVGNGLDIKTLGPALNEVESIDLMYYLGDDLLKEVSNQKLLGVYTDRIGKIAKHVFAAHACLAVWKAGPEIEVIVSENGILRNESNNEKTAFGGQVARFRDVAANRGYKAVDAFIKVMESDLESYPEWQDSDYYRQKDGLLIRSVAEFEKAGESLNGSALTFQALLPILRDIQEQRIRATMPDLLYHELVFDLEHEITGEDNKYLLDNYIRPALVKLTIQEALTTLPIEVTHSGVNVNQLELAGDARTSKMADISLMEKKAWSLRGRGEFYLSNMKEYLNTNASLSKYPLWYNSSYFKKTLRAQIDEESINPSNRRIYRA